jgi:hypothetical protein
MDTHFKLLCAWEELDHLNIEIRCVATHLQDEDHYLHTCEEAAHHTDPALAHQIFIHCMLRGRFKMHHEYCLGHIAKMKGFAGTIVPGESLDTGNGASVFPAASQPPPAVILCMCCIVEHGEKSINSLQIR